MSIVRNKAGRTQEGSDFLGLIPFGVGVFLGVVVVQSLARPPEGEPAGTAALAQGVNGAVGALPALLFAATCAWLGVRWFLLGRAQGFTRDLAAGAGLALGLSVLVGAVSGGAGGVVGGILPGILGPTVGAVLGILVGLAALAATVWLAWLRHSPVFSWRKWKTVEDGGALDTEAVAGVSPEEAEALLPLPGPETLEPAGGEFQSPLPHYPEDVRRRGGIPAGAAPITAAADAAIPSPPEREPEPTDSTPSASVYRWTPRGAQDPGHAPGDDLAGADARRADGGRPAPREAAHGTAGGVAAAAGLSAARAETPPADPPAARPLADVQPLTAPNAPPRPSWEAQSAVGERAEDEAAELEIAASDPYGALEGAAEVAAEVEHDAPHVPLPALDAETEEALAWLEAHSTTDLEGAPPPGLEPSFAEAPAIELGEELEVSGQELEQLAEPESESEEYEDEDEDEEYEYEYEDEGSYEDGDEEEYEYEYEEACEDEETQGADESEESDEEGEYEDEAEEPEEESSEEVRVAAELDEKGSLDAEPSDGEEALEEDAAAETLAEELPEEELVAAGLEEPADEEAGDGAELVVAELEEEPPAAAHPAPEPEQSQAVPALVTAGDLVEEPVVQRDLFGASAAGGTDEAAAEAIEAAEALESTEPQSAASAPPAPVEEAPAEVLPEELPEEQPVASELEEEPLEEVETVDVVLEPHAAPDPRDTHKHLSKIAIEAGCLFLERERVAISMLQRQFGLDFDASCKILDELQEHGLIGPYLGGQRRDILLSREEWLGRVGRA